MNYQCEYPRKMFSLDFTFEKIKENNTLFGL